MNIDLAEQSMRQQAALGVIERGTGLVTGGFQAQNQHFSLYLAEFRYIRRMILAALAANQSKSAAFSVTQ